MAFNAPETLPYTFSATKEDCDLLVLSSGFEDRAFHFISNANLKKECYVLIIKYSNDIKDNDKIHQSYIDEIKKRVSEENIYEAEVKQSNPRAYIGSLEKALSLLPCAVSKIWIDISGMPAYVICMTLKQIRDFKPNYPQFIIYTSAKNYHPTEEEYTKLKERQSEGVEYLPASMAKEMSENLILNSFSGQRTNEGQSCLALFAGYEVHRSAGVIENVNPSILLLLYGKPEGDGLEWRLDLSKQLHKKFEKTRKSAVEEVSTLFMGEALNCLDVYYEFLYDDFDLTIAPVCSKMHAVAAYVFWETYKEVQLIFPLPIGYSTEKRATGVGKCYLTILESQNSIFRLNQLM